jgi:hypothetical protein
MREPVPRADCRRPSTRRRAGSWGKTPKPARSRTRAATSPAETRTRDIRLPVFVVDGAETSKGLLKHGGAIGDADPAPTSS